MQQKKELNIQMGSRIRKARLQAGLTQEAFAELLNLGPKHISAMERGIVGLSMETLQNICQVLADGGIGTVHFFSYRFEVPAVF